MADSEFFFQMAEEMRKENIPILNDYILKFKDYPTKEDLIKQQEAEIKQLFIYSGRPGLWEDYQKFLANRKQLKENERKRIEQAKARKKRLIKEWSIGIAVTLAVLSAVGICAYFLYWLIATKGQ